jgi:hypothetical protein
MGRLRFIGISILRMFIRLDRVAPVSTWTTLERYRYRLIHHRHNRLRPSLSVDVLDAL